MPLPSSDLEGVSWGQQTGNVRGRQFQGREGETELSEQGWDKSKAGFVTVFLIIKMNTYILAYIKLICMCVFLYKKHTHHSTYMPGVLLMHVD